MQSINSDCPCIWSDLCYNVHKRRLVDLLVAVYTSQF